MVEKSGKRTYFRALADMEDRGDHSRWLFRALDDANLGATNLRPIERSRYLPLPESEKSDAAGGNITHVFYASVEGDLTHSQRVMLGSAAVIYPTQGEYETEKQKSWQAHYALVPEFD